MRAVNLIPPEDRRGDHGPSRTGPLAYLVLGGLAVLLIAVTGVVLTNNQISDRQASIATLQSQEAAAKAQADQLRPYAEFASLQQTREQTVMNLARSRFDWERVLRELSIVLPPDVWLIKMSATVTPSVQLEESADIAQRAEVAGPALEIVGCGASQDAVARFAAALKDVDGITRVTVAKSARPDQQLNSTSSTAQASGSGSSAVEDCRTRDFITQFEIVAAFDAVQVDSTSQLPIPPALAQPAASSTDGGVAGAQGQEAAARQSAAEQTQKANDAVSTLIPGTVR
jgi:Tfp pilus assembly protein PilN